MSEPVRGIVVAHADLARALIEAVERIVGVDEDSLVAISNEALAPSALRDRIAALAGNEAAIIFTDHREGSCGIAARQVCLDHDRQVAITGVNLPMLLDFALNRHRPLEELVERLTDRGTGSIQRLPERE